MRLLYLFICICTLFVTLWEFVKLVLLIEMCGSVGWVCRCLYEFLLSRHFCSLLICVVALSVISYGGPQLSRQNQKHHSKTKNLTTKTSRQNQNTSRQKQNTSWQNQILHCKNEIALVLPWVFAFAVRYLVFAVKYLVLP